MSEKRDNGMTQYKRGFSGSTLKLIAVITMLIDHMGLGVVGRLMMRKPYLYDIYAAMRGVGRLAFPIYIFLLVEGVRNTRSIGKYTLRMGVFALISEIPFDLAFHAKALEFTYQNVFFTLFIGLLVIRALDGVAGIVNNKFIGLLLQAAVLAAGAAGAELIRADYGAKGILCIAVIYIFSYDRRLQLLTGCMAFFWEWEAIFAFIPIAFYNGSRGIRLKYIFYIFYPLHLLLIYLLCLAMGMNFPII